MSDVEILKAAKALPLEQRIKLAQELWDDIAAEGFDPDLTPEQIAEMERRADRLRANPEKGIPWEQVRAELKERLKRRACAAK